MTAERLTVSPEDDVITAMRRFTELNLNELPVLDALQEPGLLLGIGWKDAICLYNGRLMEPKRLLPEAE